MLLQLAQRAPVQRAALPQWLAHGVDVSIWRLDQLDAAAPGNKLFKLAKNLEMAGAAGQRQVLSFGGAFSNHLHALARYGAAQGFSTIGVVRGESTAADNPTLSEARAAGMTLHFVTRTAYRLLTDSASAAVSGAARANLLGELRSRYGSFYLIPAGGDNDLGVAGCMALGGAIATMTPLPDLVVLPCATGSTLAGVAAGLADRCAVLGIAVLKGAGFLTGAVRDHLRVAGAECNLRWRIDTTHHEGGYARASPALRTFMAQFSAITGIAVEGVYSGKMLYAIDRCIKRGDFAPGSRILAIHTGGLQGARGSDYRNAISG